MSLERSGRASAECYFWKRWVIVGLNSSENWNVEVRANCYRIVQRQRHKFTQAVLLLYSTEKIQLYGEDMRRVPTSSYHSSRYYTAVITNLNNLN